MRGLSLLLGLLLLWPAVARGQKKPRTGLLDVKASVDGAQIAVDGAPVAKTPLEAPIRLPVGSHSLKVSKPGHSEYIDVIKIHPGITTRLQVSLIPFAAAVSVTSTPAGAAVYVDGKPVGVTPYQGNLDAGTRHIRIHLTGHYDATRSVEMTAGQSYNLNFPLLAVSGPTPETPPPARPFYKRWPFWAAAGAVVVLGTVSVAVIASGGNPADGADRVITPEF